MSANNFHITLSFLGNTQEKQLDRIVDGFKPIAINPFEVTLDELIYWPKPAIIGLSLKDQNQRLQAVKKLVETQLSQLDFFSFDKKKYHPHLTLFRNVELPLAQSQIFNQPLWVDHICLFSSQLTAKGPIYHLIDEWPLQQTASVKQQLLGR